VQALDDDPGYSPDQDWATFSGLSLMTNHWHREGWWPGRSGYYWYLTFGSSPEVCAMASQCQAAIRAPYFDLVSIPDLHMTLERVAFEDEISEVQLKAVEIAGSAACRTLEPFNVGPLAGSAGAISFSASPRTPLATLRRLLDDATTQAFPARGQPENPQFRPHIGIAYCNESVPTGPVIETVRRLRRIPPAAVTISAASLVVLTRDQRAYRWVERRRMALGAP
jgi:2'-5' RNA ligase